MFNPGLQNAGPRSICEPFLQKFQCKDSGVEQEWEPHEFFTEVSPTMTVSRTVIFSIFWCPWDNIPQYQDLTQSMTGPVDLSIQKH